MFEYRVRSRLDPNELAALRGKILAEDSYSLLLNPQGGPVKVLKPNGEPLLVCLPQAVPVALRESAYPVLTKIRQPTDNRGFASGSVGVKVGKQTRFNKVPSTILGSFEATSARNPVCRLTAWTGQHTEQFRTIYPYIQHIAGLFGQTVPERFEAQSAEARATEKDWVIEGTPYTTITVNNTYPTGVHVDDGDLEDGFSCLACLRRGQYRGGHLVFPEFRVAADMSDGDVLLMDAHQWHGNTGLQLESDDAERISVVLYYRTNMRKCEASERELEKAKRKAGLLTR